MESDAEYRWPQKVHPREELERGFREHWLKHRPMGMLATVYKPDGRYIGRVGLYPHRDDNGDVVPDEAVLGYYLARPYWNRGLATEAGAAFVQYGFENLGLRRIHAGMNALNEASIRVAEKLGFKRVRSGGNEETRWHDFELLNPRATS
jgi:RimJ/RimL family protein N-acetyltransferase